MGDLDQHSICEKIKDFLVIQNGKSQDDIKINHNVTYSSIEFFGNSVVRVKCSKSKSYLSFKSTFKTVFNKYESITFESIKSEPLWLRKIIRNITDLEDLFPLILELYDEAYLLINTETFSCCSRYMQCSDAMKCIHPDKIFARGCYYKKNLEAGKIFYGKNASQF